MMKYLIFCFHYDIEKPIIFPNTFSHKEIADFLINKGAKVVAGGVCGQINGKWICSGDSVSANVSARKELDSYILNTKTCPV